MGSVTRVTSTRNHHRRLTSPPLREIRKVGEIFVSNAANRSASEQLRSKCHFFVRRYGFYQRYVRSAMIIWIYEKKPIEEIDHWLAMLPQVLKAIMKTRPKSPKKKNN